MAKNTPTNIVEVWNKVAPELESGDFSATEQITLIHVIIALNRNLWTPTKINPAIIAAATRKDKRTIRAAINKLIKLGALQQNQAGGIFIGKTISDKPSVTDNPRDSRNDGDTNPDGANSGGDQNASGTKNQRRRRLFNEAKA